MLLRETYHTAIVITVLLLTCVIHSILSGAVAYGVEDERAFDILTTYGAYCLIFAAPMAVITFLLRHLYKSSK